MSKHSGEVFLEVVFTNESALTALEDAIELIDSAREDLPWKQELATAADLLQVAAAKINCVPVTPEADGDGELFG